jgi:hypothetical protein
MQITAALDRRRSTSRIYTSKIIKAGALLADTKTLLTHWNEALSEEQNIDRFRRENLFGKASRSRIEDILLIFRQRYLRERDVLPALARLWQGLGSVGNRRSHSVFPCVPC